MSPFGGRRWRLLSLAVVAVFASASIVYVYWRVNAPRSTIYVTASYPPLELRMELDRREFQENDTIAVRLFLTNIGSETVEIVFPQEWVWDRVLCFIVKDKNDATVYLHLRLMYLAVYELVLEPGEQRIETYQWNQTYNQDPYHRQPFKLGTYKIVGQTMNYGILGKNLPKDHRLETPPIAISIT